MPRATKSLVSGLGSAYGCFFKVQAMRGLWQACSSHVHSAPITGLQGHPASQGHARMLGSESPPEAYSGARLLSVVSHLRSKTPLKPERNSARVARPPGCNQLFWLSPSGNVRLGPVPQTAPPKGGEGFENYFKGGSFRLAQTDAFGTGCLMDPRASHTTSAP